MLSSFSSFSLRGDVRRAQVLGGRCAELRPSDGRRDARRGGRARGRCGLCGRGYENARVSLSSSSYLCGRVHVHDRGYIDREMDMDRE